jgi:ribosomal protein S18 acetylase RimI-like enzyme
VDSRPVRDRAGAAALARPPRSAIALRRAVEADVPFLRQVYATTREDELCLVAWTDEQKAAFIEMQFRAQKAHYQEFYPTCQFLVILLEDEPIGRLYVDRREHSIEILDVALLPAFRGRGIGRVLIEEILEEARASGRRVTIYVEHYNRARGLYDRLGFRHLATNGVYHLMEWQST